MEPVTEPHPSSSNSNYAFITHSQETLPRNLPPSIDNATLARRRRRRTSAHDQAILEEEYRKCDRPDKTKRKEITHRVQMGEKEVQIWFQNKRQSARRKAKPLLPHEIIPNAPPYAGPPPPLLLAPPPPPPPPPLPLPLPSSSQYSFEHSQTASFSFSFSSSQGGCVQTCFDSDDRGRRRRRRRRASVSSSCASPPLACSFSSDVSASRGSAYLGLSDDDDDDDLDLDLDLDRYDLDDEDGEDEDEEDEDEHRHGHGHGHENDADTDTRYSSSKRQKLTSRSSPPVFSPCPVSPLPASFPGTYDLPGPEPEPESEMTTSTHQRLQDVLSSTPAAPAPAAPPPPRRTNPRRTTAPTTPHHHQPPRLLKRTSSIRLSTSLEGKATVVLDEAPESPPPSLQVPSSAPRSTGAPQRRIVDSKVWEFYCDNQAMIRSPGHPNPQPSEAKQALGLLRNKTKPLPTSDVSPITKKKKKTAPSSPPPPSVRRPLHSSPTKAKKNRKIISQRAIATTTRLKPLSKKQQQQQQELPRDPGHESDKENRPPGAPVSPPPEPRRCVEGVLQKSRKRKRPVGDDARRILGNVSVAVVAATCEEGEEEEEVLGSSQLDVEMETALLPLPLPLPPPARVDEMECVENLLSLRGGTWR